MRALLAPAMTSGNNSYDRPRRSGASVLTWLSRILFLAGSAAIVWTLYFWVDAEIYQTMQRRHFETIATSQGVSSVRQEAAPVAEEPVPEENPVTIPGIQNDSLKRDVASDSMLALMEIPRIGISVIVAEGDSPAVLRHAAGHLNGTALPGQAGNVAIAAHRDTFFRSLQHIREGDTITLTTLADTYQYQVELVEIVEPKKTDILARSPEPTLTLITCYPFYYIGPAPRRFVVRARQISRLPGS